jgi:tRNA(adenine34) deaminase
VIYWFLRVPAKSRGRIGYNYSGKRLVARKRRAFPVNHAGYMREALVEAEKAYVLGEVPIGAIVVLGGEIIGRGHNLRETLADSTAHAEILAMREAARHIGDWRLDGATVYSTIEPCPMCAGAMIQFRVQTLVYGAPDPKAGAVDSIMDVLREPRFNHQVAVVSGILEDECREIIQRFFRELRESKREGKIKS